MQSAPQGDTGSHAMTASCRSWQTPEGKRDLSARKSNAHDKVFRQVDAKAALAEHEKEKRDTLKKTAKLREQRLAKEAEDRAADAQKPKKLAKTPKKRGLPEFIRQD